MPKLTVPSPCDLLKGGVLSLYWPFSCLDRLTNFSIISMIG